MKRIVSTVLALSLALTATLSAASADEAKKWSEKRTPNGWV